MASSSTVNNVNCTIRDQFNIQTSGGNVNISQPEINESEFNLPRLIDTFHGREQEFNTLDELFFNENINKIVLHGLPGYGKTELSKQYAQHCVEKKNVERAFWIKTELKKSANLSMIYNKYKHVPCIFVFDNALNRRSISEYEPSNNKHKMLITSHVKDWGHGVVSLPLGPLTTEPVIQIFRTILEVKYYRQEHHGLYEELGDIVDNVPLGVQIVAGYVRQRMNSLRQSFQFKDCVEELKKSKDKIIKDTFSDENPNLYEHSIYGALTVSLNKIKEERNIQTRQLAVTVLYVCAFLAPDLIRCNTLLEIPTMKELIGDKINSELELKSSITEAITLLVNFSFVNYSKTFENDIYIHRLVQSFLRQYLSSCDCDLEDKKCYRVCLYSMFSDSPLFGNDGVLKCADVSTAQECAQFIKHMFQTSNGSITKIIYEYDLFYKAAEWNRIEIIDLLLQHADINETNYNGHKVICRVARSGNVEAVDLLIERGVDVNHRDAGNRTPIESLLSKLISGYSKFLLSVLDITTPLVLLLERGASFNTNSLNKEREFFLLISAATMNNLEVLKSLLQKGLNVNSRSWLCNNNTVLHQSVAGGNLEIIQTLISHGADVNAVNKCNEPALFKFVEHVATYNRSIDKQKLCDMLVLLNCPQYATNTDIWGMSLLYYAAWKALKELVSVLIDNYGCEVNKQDKEGYTPLHCLVMGLEEDSNMEEVDQIVQRLTRAGCEVNKQNNEGNTPLHLFISKVYGFHNKDKVVQFVQTLIRYGGRDSLDIKNHDQRTPLQLLNLKSEKNRLDLKYLITLISPTINSKSE